MMKQLIFISFISCSLTFSQIQTPQASPSAKIEQTVGLTKVNIEYSRPAMRGRVIMGDLVPYGAIWRTGANANTKITFSDDVKIGDGILKAGTYAIYTRPDKLSWDIYFYIKYDNWSIPKKWDDSKVAIQLKVNTNSIKPSVENFTISIDEITNNNAKLKFSWENTQISVPFEVPTDKKTMASIKEVMKKNPNWRDYYNAAIYYRESNRDLKKAKEWIAKAIELDGGKYFVYRQQALILAALNDKKGAITASKKSLELAKKNGNQDYVRLNTKAIKKWSK